MSRTRHSRRAGHCPLGSARSRAARATTSPAGTETPANLQRPHISRTNELRRLRGSPALSDLTSLVGPNAEEEHVRDAPLVDRESPRFWCSVHVGFCDPLHLGLRGPAGVV